MGQSFLRLIPVVLLRILFGALLHEVGRHDYDASSHLAYQYDFIIVGSGSAGGVLASRLSEVEGWRVLLLEAGGPPTYESYVPGLDLTLLQGDLDWNYYTTRQKYSQRAFAGRASPYPRGKVLGGSSTINWMMYVRGNKRDYDNWEAMGNPGWNYETVLKYFKKAEDYRGTRNTQTLDYHGKGGPLVIEDKRWATPLLNGFLKAGEELGYKVIDPNGPEQIGFSVVDLSTQDGIRGSTAMYYIRPAASRPNLHVAFKAFVRRVIFDDNKKAIGVYFEQNGEFRTIYASREVILSAGAINSPQILMVSGVGPAEHLREHEISVVLDVPGVGQNLQDHPTIWGLTWTTGKDFSTNLLTYIDPRVTADYVMDRQGPLTVPFAMEGSAWTLSEEGDPNWPELQYLFLSTIPPQDYGILFPDIIGYDRRFFDDYFGSILGRTGFSIGPMLTRPKSRGSVTLSSRSPRDPPRIDPNFLSHPDDVETFVRGIKFALRIGNTSALRDTYGAKFHSKILPGCQSYTYDSDEYWACFTRHLSATLWHPSGTCKMAPASDTGAVVDHTLKVRGIQGLRVVDASIMPQITSGNLNAPVIMIGERAADLIKEEYGVPITPL